MAVLYITATPIGNLGDITVRALEVLKSVDLIICEDTRHSSRLLQHYAIEKPLASWHAHSKPVAVQRLLQRIPEDGAAAYISDAGTPGVSDPGLLLVRAAREAGIQVVPIPGASAPTTLLSVGGVPGKGYLFEGFLSPKSGRRRTALAELIATGRPFILFESPHRILKLLADLAEFIPEGEITVGRELTKRYEEVWHGSCFEAHQEFSMRSSQKGEFTILVSPGKIG
ncbi:16S rRNA (cytidine(1402)-2'-O)-methyltransferase [Spirochaeta africana]|uniref:Ribosomal RNA small subunit methyltransferase I n=1 Tax=Spirochaeta africana (strain ATCC 700263 / DSM 8902 / Z-7692) TaxID=889378 RepID=H9UFN7_SPIAZ|nr:16S rRNA (cytidine(1402)-2'-O)-methyltransferase [Spirochaeta africana]AFG36330.1 putative S-adenosylmethionine-dependent methyltransferase, YraL family [Spirochaeta africana DSM 8902]